MIHPSLAFCADVGWENLPLGYRHLDVASVAVDSRDRVYLQARFDSRVIVYEPDGTFVMSWGEDRLSARPHGITVGPDDMIYCVDDDDHTVSKCKPDGTLLMKLGTSGVASDTGCTGWVDTIQRSGLPFNHPTGVAVAPEGDIYVTDGYGNARVHRFSADGRLICSWGEPGNGPGEFMLPHGVCILDNEQVAVADRENDRIQVFGPSGEFICEWTDVQRPSDLCLGPDGLVYVSEFWWVPGHRSFRLGLMTENKPARVSILDQEGKPLLRLGGPDPCAPGSFCAPHGIAVDSRGDLYVAEVAYSFGVVAGYVPDDCHTFQKLVRRPVC